MFGISFLGRALSLYMKGMKKRRKRELVLRSSPCATLWDRAVRRRRSQESKKDS